MEANAVITAPLGRHCHFGQLGLSSNVQGGLADLFMDRRAVDAGRVLAGLGELFLALVVTLVDEDLMIDRARDVLVAVDLRAAEPERGEAALAVAGDPDAARVDIFAPGDRSGESRCRG